jgi:SpoVK/Ycf46/Vps4 family AAA+-type ATPase
MVLPIRLCWIAIVSCPDPRPGGISIVGNSDRNNHHFAFPGMGHYRLPNLTSETRYEAFRYVFQQEGITLSKELEMKLPTLAAAAIWAQNTTIFQQCARQLRDRIARRRQDKESRSKSITTSNQDTELNSVTLLATIEDVQTEFQWMNQQIRGRTNGCNVQFVSDDNNHAATTTKKDDTTTSSLFSSTVGGNEAAKASLYDALGFDPIRRHLLSSFGIQPSTGLLLYGPPGTGTFYVHKFYLIKI